MKKTKKNKKRIPPVPAEIPPCESFLTIFAGAAAVPWLWTLSRFAE
jgi:hypothetical protein